MDPFLVYFVGGIACVINFWYTLTRTLYYWVVRRQPGRVFEYSCPLPVLGSLVMGLSLFLVPLSPPIIWIAAVLMVLDSGGIHWFLIWRAWKQRQQVR